MSLGIHGVLSDSPGACCRNFCVSQGSGSRPTDYVEKRLDVTLYVKHHELIPPHYALG